MAIRLKPLHLWETLHENLPGERPSNDDDNRILPFTGSYFLFIEALES